MFYEITAEVEKTLENGLIKKVKEQYITDCLLFTEAENKTFEYLQAFYDGEIDITAIKRSKVIEIVNETESEYYFRATVVQTQLDDNGNEKELKYQLLVSAPDINKATVLMQNHLQQGLDDMRLDALVKTKIIDII